MSIDRKLYLAFGVFLITVFMHDPVKHLIISGTVNFLDLVMFAACVLLGIVLSCLYSRWWKIN
jgi:hypothetical protein